MADTAGKPIRCRAAVAWGESTPLTIEVIEVAPPREGEVRIRVLFASVCHTDVNTIGGFFPETFFPAVLGHEGGGIVESVGEGVTSVQPGDHVIPLYTPQCRSCKFCLSSKSNVCQKIRSTQDRGLMPDGTSRFTTRGATVYHNLGCSTFSEYTVVAEISVCKVNAAAPLDKVCLLGCGVSAGYGAPLNKAQVEPGSTVAIWGLGTVGLAVAMGARRAGASRIIGVDVKKEKFEIARRFGCTEVVNPDDHQRPVQHVLMDMTDGGLDYTFECIGSVATMTAALEACHKGWGVSVILGVAATGSHVSAVPSHLVTGCMWMGCTFGGWKSRDQVPQLVKDYLNKKLMVDEFITHTMPLDDINEAFDLMNAGKSLRSVISL